jgi:hypothetical protein
MKKVLCLMVAFFALFVWTGVSSDALLTSDTPSTPGITLGGDMLWDGTGGGAPYYEPQGFWQNYCNSIFSISVSRPFGAICY